MNLISFRTILIAHAARYPAWQPQDVYKLAHQAALGSEHAVIDRKRARAWLVQELAGLPGSTPKPAEEPLIDPIAEDGSIVRVHLRPFARLGLPTEPLVKAFLLTAEEFHGSAHRLNDHLQQAVDLMGDGLLYFTVRQLTGYFMEMMLKGYPAAHHSEAYTQAYHPAYRVVLISALPEEWKAYI